MNRESNHPSAEVIQNQTMVESLIIQTVRWDHDPTVLVLDLQIQVT